MAVVKICALLVALQLTIALRASLSGVESASAPSTCACAVCKKPDSIRIGEWDDKEACHWSRTHQYFWCRVQAGCSCAARWAKCGAGSAHLSQLVEKVQAAEIGADPCMFEDFTDLGKDFLVVYRNDFKYHELGGAAYKPALDGLSPLVEACEVHEPYSRALEASRLDQRTLEEVKAFLEEHPNTEAEEGLRAIAMETCFRALQAHYRYDPSKNPAFNPVGYDPCRSGSHGADVNSKVSLLCQARINTINELHSLLSAARPTHALVTSMWERLTNTQQVGLSSNGFSNRRPSWGCSYGMEKAVEWGSQFRKN